MISFDDFLKQEVDKYHMLQECNAIIKQQENIINELKERSLRYSEQIDSLLEIKEEIRDKIDNVQILGLRSGKTFIATLLNDISEILDKEV